MVIAVNQAKIHWNYFLALEHDLERVARYIEFCDPNFSVFSVELARLLFAAASEVDVVSKLLCELISPGSSPANINEYKSILIPSIPNLPETEIFVPRYGLSFKPWLNWAGDLNPDWWKSYNNVKHERDAYYHQATLKNALNALGALLILVFHYYSRKLATEPGGQLAPKSTTLALTPKSTLMRLGEAYYHVSIVY